MELNNISVNAQSSIRIIGSKNLYFDAFQIKNEAHDADIIFITHEHFDHYDISAVKNILKETSIIIAPETMKEKLLNDVSADESRFIFMIPGMSVKKDGVGITGVPAYNIHKPFHPEDNKWLGYVVTMDGVTYYISGDTDALKENISINCDVALVPVGGGYTMDKEQAAEFTAKMSPKAAIPVHYGCGVGMPEDGKDFKNLVEELNSEIQVELKLGLS